MAIASYKSGVSQLVLRLGLAGIFMSHGAIKILVTEGGFTWFKPVLPNWAQATVAWVELIAGILLLLGLFTRVASLAILVDQIGAICLVTGKLGLIKLDYVPSQSQGDLHLEVGWEYNLALITMALALIFMGSGVIGLDHYLWRRRASTAEPKGYEAPAPVPAGTR
jgi:putative oxidoreductase